MFKVTGKKMIFSHLLCYHFCYSTFRLSVPFLLFGKAMHSISKKQGVLEPVDRDSKASQVDRRALPVNYCAIVLSSIFWPISHKIGDS